MSQVDAVVLAGAKNDGRLKAVDNTPYEAAIMIAGRPMLYYVLDALADVADIRRIVVVAPPGLFEGDWQGKVQFVPCDATMVENIRRGLDALQTRRKVLIVTSDIPLLTPAAVKDFISRCRQRNADLYYPIISRTANDQQFPGVKRTYVRLREGVFTGGNMALLEPEIVATCHRMIGRAVAMRKKPWQLSRLLGFKFIIKFLFNRLSLAEIENRVGNILGFRGAAIICPYPEVGIDIDKPSDLQIAKEIISRRNAAVQEQF